MLSFRAKKRKRILECDTPVAVTTLADSKENHSGLTQEILALDLSQNTPKRQALHPTPDRRKNPIKGVLKKRCIVFIFNSICKLLYKVLSQL